MLPRTGLEPRAAAALLKDLADRAQRSEFEPVLCLEAPEAVDVSHSLLRRRAQRLPAARGRAVRHAPSWPWKKRMLAPQARADGAPRLTRADPARLEDALAGSAYDAQDKRTQNRAARGSARYGGLIYGGVARKP